VNGRRAKEIRRQVYGVYSPRNRSYARYARSGQIVTTGLRADYQRAKKEAKQ